MPYDSSPNMALPIPQAGTTPGPEYAVNGLNASLSIIDGHDHSPGHGVAITPNGLSLTTDLSFQTNNAIDLRSTRFTSQGSPLAQPLDLGCVYVSGVDLYFNDGSGNQIRITQSGSIAGTSGSIGNLVSPASATYVSGTPAFVFQSAANTSANLDGGSLTIRNNTASAPGITIAPPGALAGNYTVTLPLAPPASTKIMAMDASGNVSAAYGVDNVTIELSSNNLQIKALPANSVITTAILDGAVTKPKLAALGNAESASFVTDTALATTFTTFAGLNLTITTTGRPIVIGLYGDPTANAYLETITTTTTNGQDIVAVGQIQFFDSTNSVALAQCSFGTQLRAISPLGTNVHSFQFPAGAANTGPIPLAAGTYTITTRGRRATPTTGSARVQSLKLFAYEL